MTMYDRIKKRRRELDMSQDELAEKCGYTGRSMISRVEKGEIDIPQSKVSLFAKALGVTPAYLFGMEDADYSVDLSADEQVLIEWYRSAPEHDRDFLRRMMAYSDKREENAV